MKKNSVRGDSKVKRLNFLIGRWHTEGEVLADSSSKPAEIRGMDVYERVCGGSFLLHRVDVIIGKEKIEVIELIGGYDASTKSYPMRSFDNNGNFVTMYASLNKNNIMKIKGNKIRSTLKVNRNGDQMTAKWERTENGMDWIDWMNMKFTK